MRDHTAHASPGAERGERASIRIRRQLVTEARQSFGSHAARQFWSYLNLPIVPAMTTPDAPEFPFTYTAIRQDPPPDNEKDAA